MTYPFHVDVQRYFPDFDYRQCAGDRAVICDYRDPGNFVGHQQRAVTVYWALKLCGPLDLGIDMGTPRGLTPYCIHVDVNGTGRPHPAYGGGYLADVVHDAGTVAPFFSPGAFPYVASNHSLEHMPSVGDDGVAKILDDWIGLLRPGGVLAMVIPDNDHFDVMACDKDHRHAWGAKDFRARVLDKVKAPREIIEYDTLANNFSFNVILRKTAGP
jgi:hypothetical protein